MTRRNTILVLVACVVAGGVSVIAFVVARDPLRTAPRREWKDQALAKIERRLGDREALRSEVDRIAHASAATRPAPDAWVGPDVLVMKNGDWVAYESICRKQDARVHDLFVGRGSDGRWYYSTFHFCVRLTVLRGEAWQPDSLAQFTDAYLLAPFDGQSDECLKATWTGREPYGQAKVQRADTRTDPAP